MNKFKQIELENIIELRKEKYNPLESDTNKPCIELEHFDQETGQINGYISSLEQKSIKNVFYKGDILFGKLRPYLKKYWLAEFDGVCSSEAWVLKPKNNNIITKKFLFYLVQSELFIRIANISSGSKMPRADWNYISEYPFPIPPLEEQEKIAEILLSCDKAIRLTTQIITQLKQRNQGLAQQLLTGEKRVKGFENSIWKSYSISEICKIGRGRVISAKYISENKGIYPVYSSQTQNEGVFGKINTYNFEGEYITWTTDGVNAGTVSFREGKFNCTNVCGTLKVIDVNNFSHKFLAYKLATIAFQYVSYTLANPKLMNNTMGDIIIDLPEITEQNAIAQILDTAHQELKLYEQKLQLLQAQKKTLMQKLLTGEVLTIKK